MFLTLNISQTRDEHGKKISVTIGLKHIKNNLCSTMNHEKAGSFSLLFIENEKLLQFNFDNVIQQLATKNIERNCNLLLNKKSINICV